MEKTEESKKEEVDVEVVDPLEGEEEDRMKGEGEVVEGGEEEGIIMTPMREEEKECLLLEEGYVL